MGIDIGKALNRMITPSQRHMEFLERIGPMAAGIVGAATGNMAVAGVGAAFGNKAEQFGIATGEGLYGKQIELQHELAMAQLYRGAPAGSFAGAPGSPGLGEFSFDTSSSKGGSGSVVAWVVGAVVLAGVAYYVAS